MKKMWKRALSVLLAVIMVVGLAPVGELAKLDWPTLPDGAAASWFNDGMQAVKNAAARLGEKLHGLSLRASAETYTGTCGDNLTWSLDTNSGVLTISGTGEILGPVLANGHYASWTYWSDPIRTVIINEGATSIRPGVFRDIKTLVSVTIPDSMTRIGSGSFDGCLGILSVTIPDSVTSIGDFAFGGVCNVAYSGPATGSPWGARSTNGFVNGFLVYDSAKRQTVRVCSRAVQGSMTIPDSVTSIGDSAFDYCTGLTNITLPNSIKNIGTSAFFGCTSLTSVTIPNSVTNIRNYTFSGCMSLTSVTIPNSVTSIGTSAFFGCTSLTSVTIPNSVTNIRNYTFYDCKSLTSVTIPNSVTEIGISAFSNCTSLASVTISNSLKSIDMDTFSNCTSLTSVMIPDSVTEIGDWAFDCCTSLTSVTIPNSVTYIGYGAFTTCTNLLSVTIPTSVTSIEEDAFCNCSSLNDVYYRGSESEWAAVQIGEGNKPLLQATIHYNSTLNPNIPSVTNVENISLNKTSLFLEKGSTETLSATVSPSDATNKTVIWTSSNAKVATVDGSGKVTAVSAGTSTITAKTADGHKTATCSVTVGKKDISVSVSPQYETIHYYNGKAFTEAGERVSSIRIEIAIKNNTNKAKNVYVKQNLNALFSFSPDSVVKEQTDTRSVSGGSSLTFSIQVFPIDNYNLNGKSNSVPLVFLDLYWDNAYNAATNTCYDESKHIREVPRVFYELPLDFQNDAFLFLNEKEYFVNQSEPNKYIISPSTFDLVPLSYYLDIKAQSLFHWNGSCLGMSALLANLKSKRTPLSCFGVDSGCIKDLDSPVNRVSVRDAINIVQCAQKTTMLLSTTFNLMSQSKLATMLWESLCNLENGGTLPVLCLKTGGVIPAKHAVVAYNMVDLGDYYSIDIVDPNYEFQQNLKLKHDLSGLYEDYDDFKKIDCVISDLSLVDIQTYAPGFTGSMTSWKMGVMKTKGHDNPFPNEGTVNYTIISLQDFKEVNISNSKNETLTINYENETVSGNLDATIDTVIGGENDPIIQVIIREEDSSECYHIFSTSDYTLSIYNDQVVGQARISGSDSSCVSYSPDGLIKLENDMDADYSVSLYSNKMTGDIYSVTVTGDSATETSIQCNESGVLLASDDMENNKVTVEHFDDFSEDVFGSLGDSGEVLVAVDQDNNTELYINCDEHDDYETKLDTHIYKVTLTEPTCTQKGYYHYACTTCEDEYDEEIPMLQHTPEAPVVENEVLSTCTESGSYDAVVKCKDCGQELSRETISLEAYGHIVGDPVLESIEEPSCDKNGSYNEVVCCSICGEELSRETIAAGKTDHTDENDDGICDICGQEIVCYHVVYNTSGGYNAPQEQTKEKNVALTLSFDIPIRVGYSFVEWNTKEDGSGTTYHPGDTFSSNSNLTLYAQWNGISGDINYDGGIDLKDVIILVRFLAGGWNVEADANTADVNRDGKVDLKDVVLIRRYLAGGWNVVLR